MKKTPRERRKESPVRWLPAGSPSKTFAVTKKTPPPPPRQSSATTHCKQEICLASLFRLLEGEGGKQAEGARRSSWRDEGLRQSCQSQEHASQAMRDKDTSVSCAQRVARPNNCHSAANCTQARGEEKHRCGDTQVDRWTLDQLMRKELANDDRTHSRSSLSPLWTLAKSQSWFSRPPPSPAPRPR